LVSTSGVSTGAARQVGVVAGVVLGCDHLHPIWHCHGIDDSHARLRSLLRAALVGPLVAVTDELLEQCARLG
jgi:hypothetical protein